MLTTAQFIKRCFAFSPHALQNTHLGTWDCAEGLSFPPDPQSTLSSGSSTALQKRRLILLGAVQNSIRRCMSLRGSKSPGHMKHGDEGQHQKAHETRHSSVHSASVSSVQSWTCQAATMDKRHCMRAPFPYSHRSHEPERQSTPPHEACRRSPPSPPSIQLRTTTTTI